MDVSAIQNPVILTSDIRLEAQRTEAREASQAEPQAPVTMPVDISVILSELQQVSMAFNRRLSFSVNEKLDQVVVKVIDTQSDKVIKEIPPVELQHVHERIREVIGILFDERA